MKYSFVKILFATAAIVGVLSGNSIAEEDRVKDYSRTAVMEAGYEMGLMHNCAHIQPMDNEYSDEFMPDLENDGPGKFCKNILAAPALQDSDKQEIKTILAKYNPDKLDRKSAKAILRGLRRANIPLSQIVIDEIEEAGFDFDDILDLVRPANHELDGDRRREMHFGGPGRMMSGCANCDIMKKQRMEMERPMSGLGAPPCIHGGAETGINPPWKKGAAPLLPR